MPSLPAAANAAPKKRDTLYLQVLLGIIVGILVGLVWPEFGAKLKWLGDAFVALVKMLIAPIIFTTVVAGLAGMGDLKRVGRVGGKALLYFEIVTTLALLIGLVVANFFNPERVFTRPRNRSPRRKTRSPRTRRRPNRKALWISCSISSRRRS